MLLTDVWGRLGGGKSERERENVSKSTVVTEIVNHDWEVYAIIAFFLPVLILEFLCLLVARG